MSGGGAMDDHHVSADDMIRALDLAGCYLASGAEPFDMYPLEHWVREWLPDFVNEVIQ